MKRPSAILRSADQTPIICPNWCHPYWNLADTLFCGLFLNDRNKEQISRSTMSAP